MSHTATDPDTIKPAELREAIDALDDNVATLALDAFGYLTRRLPAAAPSWWRRWRSWVAGWRSWRADMRATNVTTVSAATVRELRTWYEQLTQWRTFLERAGVKHEPAAEVGGDYRSPGEVAAAIRQVGQEATRTHEEVNAFIRAGSLLPGTLATRWGNWYRRFQAWFTEVNGSTWATLWGSTWDDLEGYQRELAQFRAEFARAGARFASTQTSIDRPRSNPLSNAVGGFSKVLAYALGFAVVGGVVYVASKAQR